MGTDLDELAALDAAGALDEADLRQYHERLKTASAAERTAIAQFYDLAAAVASEQATVAPPSGSLERLMQRIEASQVYRSGVVDMYSVLAHEGDWRPGPVAGTRVKILSLDRARDVATLLMRVDPGAYYPAHHHSSAEDCYVISGEIIIQGQRLHAGDFHRAEAGSDHAPLSSETGAEVLLVVGATDYHL
jgi:quercetin dioxygenase-like cupin family protein